VVKEFSIYTTILKNQIYCSQTNHPMVHCKRKFSDVPVPSRDVTNAPWPGIVKLFLAGESLVSDIQAGDGNIANLFYSVE
jgi:hypothetical protein